MDVRALRYFVTVADEQSFTKAAERLHMSQPPLSKQIRQLEESLGVCLFDRSTRSLYLTQAGELLYMRARSVISQMDDIETFFREFRGGKIGSFSIGAMESASIGLLPGWLCAFEQKYPQIAYSTWTGDTGDILRRLHQGTVDFGIVRTPYQHEGLSSVAIQKDVWGCLINRNYVSAPADERISLDQLPPSPLIISDAPGRSDSLVKWLSECGSPHHVKSTYNSLYSVTRYVENGAGVAICPSSIQGLLHSGSLVFKPLTVPVIESRLDLVWLENRHLSAAAKTFLDFVC